MRRIMGTVLLAVALVDSSARTAAQKPPGGEQRGQTSAAERIEGLWMIRRDTPRGRFTRIKEHRDGISTVTTWGPDGKVIQSHRSRYSVEEKDSVCIFRYSHKTMTTGPNAGAVDDSESAYLFRVDDREFVEVHGLLRGDRQPPSMATWKRLEKMPDLSPDI